MPMSNQLEYPVEESVMLASIDKGKASSNTFVHIRSIYLSLLGAYPINYVIFVNGNLNVLNIN